MKEYLMLLVSLVLLFGCIGPGPEVTPTPTPAPTGTPVVTPTPVPETPTPAPTGTVFATPTPTPCIAVEGTATVTLVRTVGPGQQAVRQDVVLRPGESISVNSFRVELSSVREAGGIPFAYFKYYIADEFQREVSGAATPQYHVVQLNGTSYELRISSVTPPRPC